MEHCDCDCERGGEAAISRIGGMSSNLALERRSQAPNTPTTTRSIFGKGSDTIGIPLRIEEEWFVKIYLLMHDMPLQYGVRSTGDGPDGGTCS